MAMKGIATQARQHRLPQVSQPAFSLLELLCVIAIMAAIAGISVVSVTGVVTGRVLSRNVYDLAGIIREARTAAMTQNTYIGIGFHEYDENGSPMLMIGSVAARSGLLDDLKTDNFRPLSRGIVLQNVKFNSSGYLALDGVDQTNNTDVSESEYSFEMVVPGNGSGPVRFTKVIIFSPNGQVNVKDSSLTRCLGIGLASGAGSTHEGARVAAVQVAGLSGNISVFQ